MAGPRSVARRASPRSVLRSRAAVPHGVESRGLASRVIHAGTAAVVMSVRSFFERELHSGRSILQDRPAERTMEATGLSFRSIYRLANEGHRGGLPVDGTPEKRVFPKRAPSEALVRVHEAIYTQYHNPTLPTLHSTLENLTTLEVGGERTGAGQAAAGVLGTAPKGLGGRIDWMHELTWAGVVAPVEGKLR